MADKNAKRYVLPNVPRVGFYDTMLRAGLNRCPEDMTFPASLRAILSYLGEERLGCKHAPPREAARNAAITGCGYGLLMGLCGEAFALSWNMREWDWGNGSILKVHQDPLAPVRWALDGMGYAWEALGNPQTDQGQLFSRQADEAEFRARIIASLQAGRPVLGIGVAGPPESCVITGYDEGGDVLIGWSFFQEFPEFAATLQFEPESGYFRKRDWFRDTVGIVLVGERTAAPDMRDLYRTMLEHALEVMRASQVQDTHYAGLAAWDAWIAALLSESEFAGQDSEALRQRHGVHDDAVGKIAERRAYGGGVLIDVAQAFPEAADELSQAAGCFGAEHDHMWRVWQCVGDFMSLATEPVEAALRFAHREVRERVVDILRQARARDAEAIQHLEAALDILKRGDRPRVKQIARRAVLEDVPYIGFDAQRTGDQSRHTFMVAALHSALHYLDENYSYEFLMGVSGAAFRLAWNAERWDGGNISTLCMGDDPLELYQRAFRAVSWVPQFLGNARWHPDPQRRQAAGAVQPPADEYIGHDYLGPGAEYHDEPRLRERIIESIRFNRYPVLAIGVILPPECGLITGYDEGGDVLIGWNHFQAFCEMFPEAEFEPSGYYRKRNWFDSTTGLILFHYKTAKPSLAQTYRSALEWAVKLGRTSRFRMYHSGLAAYTAWAKALQRDDEFATTDEVALGVRLMCHNDAIACIGEGREAAATFVREVAQALPPMADALEDAARCYEAEGETVGRIIGALGGLSWGADIAHKLARPEVRRTLARLIEEARGHEERALVAIERALAVDKPKE